MSSLTGKIAWVTGADSGIGQAAAIALAAEGATVVLTGRRREPLQETAATIKAAGGKADIKPGDLMKAASFDPSCFYLQWHVAEKWTNAHPGAIGRLSAMIDEAYAKLSGDDGVWTALAQKVRITDPVLIAAYRDQARKIANPPYGHPLIASTQKLVDAIVALAGEDAVGFTTLDPAAFVFPRGGRA